MDSYENINTWKCVCVHGLIYIHIFSSSILWEGLEAMNENTSLHDFGFPIPLSNKWNQSSLEKWQDPSLGQEKQRCTANISWCQKVRSDQRMIGVCWEDAGANWKELRQNNIHFDIWATIHMIVIDYTAIDETQHSN